MKKADRKGRKRQRGWRKGVEEGRKDCVRTIMKKKFQKDLRQPDEASSARRRIKAKVRSEKIKASGVK